MKQIVSFGAAFFLFIAVVTPVDAKVWINEFSSDNGTDWVEIYNDSDIDVVPLSTYQLKDGSASGNPLTLAGILSAKGYMVFEWGMSLNKSGDIIHLIDTVSGSEVDTVVYGTVEGKLIDAPAGGQYGARETDGGAKFSLFTSDTKGSSNGNAQPAPTATPEPTSTPKPTTTPTKVPTPTKSPTPTKVPTPTATKTATPTPRGAQTQKTVQTYPTPTIDHHVPTAVLAAKTMNSDTKVSPTNYKQQQKILGIRSNNSAIIYAGMGVSMILICGILAYLRYRNTLEGK